MFRRVTAAVLCAAVQVAIFTAPFVHAHPDDHETNHHEAHAVHAHWTGHTAGRLPPKGPAVEDQDHDRAIYLQASVAVGTSVFSIPIVPPHVFHLVTPDERPAHPTVEVTHGHDPPRLPALDSRPPPASPVLI